MARAKAGTWFNLVAGLAVGAAANPLPAGAAPKVTPPAHGTRLAVGGRSVAQLGGVHSQARFYLDAGLDAQRRGDSEAAARYLRAAQARQGELNSAELDALGRALGGEARGQMPGTPQAPAGAVPAAPAASTLSGPGGALATVQARAKLQQARAHLLRSNFDAAEQLAREAASLNPSLLKDEDSPQKVLAEVGKLRADPKALLAAARSCLHRHEFDRAEQYARLAEKNSSFFTFSAWSDNPTKVLKEVKAGRSSARTATAPKISTPAAATKPDQSAAVSNTPASLASSPSDEARALLKQSRKALQDGNLVLARQLNEQARAKKPALNWWDDNPEKVHADIVRAEAHVKPANAAKTPGARKGPVTKEEAVATLQAGRVQLASGKLEEATQTALKVKGMNVSWGLFDDTPDSLRQDVEKARVKRDREESVKVLAEARKLYEKGQYDQAKAAAYRAQRLHGAYTIWDLGDRPEKVIDDVKTAMLHRRQLPPAPGELVRKDAQRAAVAQSPRGGDGPALPPLVSPPAVRTGAGDPRGSTDVVRKGPAVIPPAVPTPTLPGAPTDATKARAVSLVLEARQLQSGGRLMEARAKAVEAQRLGASFSPEEDNPGHVLLQLGVQARRQVDTLVREATDKAGYNGSNPLPHYQDAEQRLSQAHALASAFGLDVQPVDARLAWVRNIRSVAQNGGRPGSVLPPPPDGLGAGAATPGSGQDLLAKVRLELRSGQTGNARKLAEQACQPQYGVQDAALALLREVDIEEANQRRLEAVRTFDAAEAAFRRREYSVAGNLLHNVETHHLDPARRARLREIAQSAELQPTGAGSITQVKAPGGTGLPALTPTSPGVDAGHAAVSDNTPGQATLQTTEAMRQVVFQKLRGEGLEAQRSAGEKFKTGQTDAALELLQDYLGRVNEAQLEANQAGLLRHPVERRLEQYKLLKAQRDFLNEEKQTAQAAKDRINQATTAEQHKQKQVAELTKQYHTLFKEAKYDEALAAATKAHELDPDNEMTTAMVSLAKSSGRRARSQGLKDDKEKLGFEGLEDTDNWGNGDAIKTGVTYDKDRWGLASKRKPGDVGLPKSARRRDLERQLEAPVNLVFNAQPLHQIFDDIRSWQSVNIWVDEKALEEEGISLGTTLSIKLEQVSLKTALAMLLHNARLTYVVRDDGVLEITTPAHSKGRLEPHAYQVADMVIPVQDFGSINTPLGAAQAPLGSNVPGAVGTNPTPVTGSRSLTTGTPVGTPTGQTTENGVSVRRGGPAYTTEESLINLITNTIAPETWSARGGPGNIEYFPMTMTLVVNQTPDIQEQVADLLAALRRLQDQEVAIEVRFITIADNFFERIGVNFNLNIRTDKNNAGVQPDITSGIFTPEGQINNARFGHFIGGLQPNGSFTPDLSIPINTQTFTQAIPSFGGYQGIPGFGGITMGLAFLSEIQVFLFMEAVQGDTRTNVMQAPKLTLFNGQTATLTVQDEQFFLNSVNVAAALGQFIYVPQVQPFQFGVQLTLQAVISADRRFVRVSPNLSLTNLASPIVELFPVVTPVFPQLDNTATGTPIVFTQFIQQPIISQITVQTTVAVPDGGTVLLGGLKRLSEDRKEYGPPILSKIPYLNRLFKNTAYGREAESLLIMITPRIIIQEEEEQIQTGYVRTPPPAGTP